MLRHPPSAAFGGIGQSLTVAGSDSGTDVFGKDGLPGQVRQRRSGAFRVDHAGSQLP
jgi:hypothetical protein